MKKNRSAVVVALIIGFAQVPLWAELAPEIAERVRGSVVMIETGEGSSGTGFFVGDSGLLLTCSHVLETNPSRVDVRFMDDTTGEAEFVSFDPTGLDLAALRLVEGAVPASLELSTEPAPRPGRRIFLSGNPYPLFPSLMSTGIIGHHRDTHRMFVHDAASSSGSSGSPVVDAAGRVVGISVSLFTNDEDDSGSSHSTGFSSAIDASAIRAFIGRVAAGERSDVKTGHVEYLRYPLPAIEPGRPVAGELTAASDRNPGDQSYSHGFTLDLEEGDLLHITLKSEDFDAFLMLHDNDSSLIEENDDAPGGGTDSAITFEVPETARYVVVATSLERGETGDFTLQADTLKFGEPDVSERQLAATDPQQDEGARFQTVPIPGKPGRWLSVTMRSSELDSLLRLIGPDGSQVAENDDWQEGSTDARVLMRIEEAGDYQIIATTFGNEEVTGPFELEIAWSED